MPEGSAQNTEAVSQAAGVAVGIWCVVLGVRRIGAAGETAVVGAAQASVALAAASTAVTITPWRSVRIAGCYHTA